MSRVDVLDLMSYYNIEVVLRGEEAQFSCPFHNDRSPSASVNIVIGEWTCYRCKIGGSMIEFVSRLEGWAFKKADQWIRNRYGGFYKPASLLREVGHFLKKAEDHYYSEKILKSYQNPHKYWKKRKISQELQDRWELGFDPNTKRVTIPIRHINGRLLGIQGRTVLSSDSNKYVFIKNFSKKQYLFGIHLIETSDWVVVVESVITAIKLDGLGIPCVSTMGSVVSEAQAQYLNSFDKVYMLFDNDSAGWLGMIGPTEPHKFKRSKIAAWKKITTKVFIPINEEYDDLDNLNEKEIFNLINTSKNAHAFIPILLTNKLSA